jgi:hypothetical protein
VGVPAAPTRRISLAESCSDIHMMEGAISTHALNRGVQRQWRLRYVGGVLWLGRPPYLRWLAAGALIVAAFLWDISERATEAFPFAATELTRGQPITDDDVEWRQVPIGSLVLPDLVGATAAVTIRLGDPIVTSLVSAEAHLGLNSWAVPVSLPVGATQGTAVKLVFADGSDVLGVVVEPATADPLGFDSNGLVAVANEAANSVAIAAANGDLVVLVAP